MLQLRKGKQIIAKYPSAYACAEDADTWSRFYKNEREVDATVDFLLKNAFQFAIVGAQARLGYGLILESAAD